MSGFLPRFSFYSSSPLPIPPSPSTTTPPSSPKYDFFLEVQQQPLVELSSCFSLSTVVQETPSLLSIDRKVCPCGYHHTCMLFLQVRDQDKTLNVQKLCFVMVIVANFSSWSFEKNIYVTINKHLSQMSHSFYA